MAGKGNRKATGVRPTSKSKRSPKQNTNNTWYNASSLAALALLLVNTRATFLKFFKIAAKENDLVKKEKRQDESELEFQDRILEQANEWNELKYEDAKYMVVKNIDKLAENDKKLKTLISDSAMNMNISAETEQNIHTNVVLTLFGNRDNRPTPKNLSDQVETPKHEAFLKSSTKLVISVSKKSTKRKLSATEPRPIRGNESEDSPKRAKVKIVQDGDNVAMPDVVIVDDSLSPKKRHDSKNSSSEGNGSSPSCTLPKSPISFAPSTPAPPVSLLNLSANSQMNTPSPKIQSFDSSLEGLIQVTLTNQKIVNQKAKVTDQTCKSKAPGIKIRNPDSPSHCGNKQNDSVEDSPQNKILHPSAWSKDPLLATDAGMAWTLGGLMNNGSQVPGTSSKCCSTPMETTAGTSKRKSDDITPPHTQFKKSRKASPVKTELPNPNSKIDNNLPKTNSNDKPKEKKKHAIPAFFFPRNVKNYSEFCMELAEKNPEIRNGFDLGTFKNGQKYIKPRTLQIANRFKSPLTAFGMLHDFTQVNADQKTGHTVKVIKVPYSRNTCKSFDSNTDINWIRVADIRENPTGMRTCTLIINFKHLAPPKVFIGQIAFSTHAHKPEPKRCTKCQHFGHYKKQCKRDVICTFCAQHHDSSVCYQKKQNNEVVVLKCTNCQGPHAASSKKCPIYIASVHSMQNEPSAQPTMSASAPKNPKIKSTNVSNVPNVIPSLLDPIAFPPLHRRRDNRLHIPYDESLKHKYSGNMAITLHLLRQMQKVHPTAKLAIENLAFSIGGESFRDTVKK